MFVTVPYLVHTIRLYVQVPIPKYLLEWLYLVHAEIGPSLLQDYFYLIETIAMAVVLKNHCKILAYFIV